MHFQLNRFHGFARYCVAARGTTAHKITLLPASNEDENEEGHIVSDPDSTPGEKVAAAFNEAMNEKTSPFDGHPAPMQRIRWIQALQDVPDVEDDGRPAWELLENAAALQELMTREIDARVQEYIENNRGNI